MLSFCMVWYLFLFYFFNCTILAPKQLPFEDAGFKNAFCLRASFSSLSFIYIYILKCILHLLLFVAFNICISLCLIISCWDSKQCGWASSCWWIALLIVLCTELLVKVNLVQLRLHDLFYLHVIFLYWPLAFFGLIFFFFFFFFFFEHDFHIYL